MKRGLVTVLLAGLALSVGAGGHASAAVGPVLKRCGGLTPVECGSVVVALDPSGRHPGSVKLKLQELPSLDSEHGAATKLMFMVAGGPGQDSVGAFDLKADAAFWRALFPGYTLVAYDDRGTGGSGRISCPGLAAAATADPAQTAAVVGACGRSLGARSSLYSTRTNAFDMDSIRQALGADTISVFGVSYGTKQALGYALVYPSHVDRLVLDSVVSAAWPDAYYTGELQGLPRGLDQLCPVGCAGLSGTPGGNFVKLANQLAATPIVAEVPRPGGTPTHVRLDGYALIELGLDTDLDPGVAVQLPADVSAALGGDPRQLERLVALDDQSTGAEALGIDLAVNVATECSDGRFFWDPASAVSTRSALLEKALAGLQPGATGRFGSWAALGGAAEECENWPRASADSSLPAGPYPNVPVLILSGSRDVRTPTVAARKVAARFPRSKVVVIAGAGHAVTGSSTCADAIVAAWLRGAHHNGCARLPLFMTPLGAPPAAPAATTGMLSAAETLELATYTLHEAQAMSLTAVGLKTEIGGLAGGVLQPDRNGGGKLVHYSDIDGVTLDGYVAPDLSGSGRFVAYVTVRGSRAVSGVVAERHGKLISSLTGG
ncbi:MAG TPA: alpha/beta hydrolase [Gaiellaceae bacterium]|nr:alpha/beta hydrolase [Gaiellaceae bacterium]